MKKICTVLLFSIFLQTGISALVIIEKNIPATQKVRKVDSLNWNAWLKKYVKKTGFVRYRAGKIKIKQVRVYIEYLLSLHVSALAGRNEKLAYYINLYNALTVYLVLKQYPVKSVMHDFPGSAFFKATFYLGGRKLSLDRLEKKIILPRFKEPLVHFALNCASYSCPPLYHRAYTGKGLKFRLRKQASSYIKNKNFARLDKSAKTLHIVELFEWYKKDLKDPKAFFLKYSGSKIDLKDYKIKFIPYNWKLNGR